MCETPTVLLLALQYGLGEWSPRHVRFELEARYDRSELSERQTGWLAAAAVQALADDSEPRNADWGMGILTSLGATAEPYLERGLSSKDWQTRQLCADVLRNRYVPRWYEVGPFQTRVPPLKLIEVSVEGLIDDALPFGPAPRWGPGQRAHTPVHNARSSLRFLARCGSEAEQCLLTGLASEDPQQRFFAACAAGYARKTGMAAQITKSLLPHLFGDDVDCNAKLAAGALYALGEPARPAVELLAMTSPDVQARRVCTRILREWTGPPESREESMLRHDMYWSFSEDPFQRVRAGEVPYFHPFPDFR